MVHRNITFLDTAQGSSRLAEGDIFHSSGRGRTTSHPRGFSPSCQGT